MLFWRMVRLAVRSLGSNQFRSFLTMLGIIIGVCSVITLIAFSEGTKKEIRERFERMGASRVTVYLNRWGSKVPYPPSEVFTMEDVFAIRQECTAIRKTVPMTSARFTIRRQNKTVEDVNLMGTETDFFPMLNASIGSGRFFNEEENVFRGRVCVMGSEIKENLFFQSIAVDQFILIGGKRFKVVGVVNERGGGRGGSDGMIFIPYYTAMERMKGFHPGVGIQFDAHSTDHVDLAVEQVEEVLYARHPRIPFPGDDWADHEKPIGMWKSYERLEQQAQMTGQLEKLLLVIGSLALFIGGVGVMNIMLFTVKERTREIGLRKALGATGLHVLAQFMLEAMVICVMGGVVGTASSVVLSQYISRLPEEMNLPDPIITSGAITVAVVITLSIGMFFGIYPATKAAQMDPIDALRYQ